MLLLVDRDPVLPDFFDPSGREDLAFATV